MEKVVQCTPNFSEGRRTDVVESIVRAISGAGDVKVVDYSWDTDHNRSVVTFIGNPESIRKSAFAAAESALELIDMNQHTGGHPRVGAIDVVPVTPVQGISREEAVDLSHTIGREIAERLSLPVYFYEWSAYSRHRRNLAVIRREQFELLKTEKLIGERTPDAGPHAIHPTGGVCVVGARGPLVAYNVNLATSDIRIAQSIAAKIRNVRDSGEGMHGVKAIGVWLESRGVAQVSTNITDPTAVTLSDVFEFVAREADSAGVAVLESELIGAIRSENLPQCTANDLKCPTLTHLRVIDNYL